MPMDPMTIEMQVVPISSLCQQCAVSIGSHKTATLAKKFQLMPAQDLPQGEAPPLSHVDRYEAQNPSRAFQEHGYL